MLFIIMFVLCIFGLVALAIWTANQEASQPPIVISNHVQAIGMDYPPNALVRINLAWVGGVDEVRQILKNVGDHKVYLDYPTGRTKPPQPKMKLEDAWDIANKFVGQISHFAFSNAWDAAKPAFISKMRKIIHPSIELVPKIETKGGVNHLAEIVEAAKTKMVMLDAEDLYVNCNHNPKVFNKYKEKCRKRCKELGVTCIELKGVVFGYED